MVLIKMQGHVAWIVAGFIAGGAVSFVQADTVPERPSTAQRSNVVVLKNEKSVTWAQSKVPLREVAKVLSSKAGKKLSIAPALIDQTVTYTFLLKGVPLSRVMNAIAYMVGGVWVSEGAATTLRPILPAEIDVDDPAYEAALGEMLGYFSAVDENDPSLPVGASAALSDFRRRMKPGGVWFPADIAGALKNGAVAAPNSHCIVIKYDDASGERRTLMCEYGD